VRPVLKITPNKLIFNKLLRITKELLYYKGG